MIGLDLTELGGAAISPLAFPMAVARITFGVSRILTGKSPNASKVRDSAEKRREWQWFLWPPAVGFFATVVFIVAAFLNGDSYWFASYGTNETPRAGTSGIPRTIRKDAGFVWTLQSLALHSRVVSDDRVSDAVGLSMAAFRKSAGTPWLVYMAPGGRVCWVWRSQDPAGKDPAGSVSGVNFLSGVSFRDGHSYEAFYNFRTDERDPDMCGGLGP